MSNNTLGQTVRRRFLSFTMKFSKAAPAGSHTASRARDGKATAVHAHEHHEHDHAIAIPRAAQPLHFKVRGMHCAGCAGLVQRAIESQPGVQSAAVSVTEGRATVQGDGLDAPSIIRAVHDSGYEAELIDELPAPAELRSEIELRQSRNEREWKRRAMIGLSIWAPLEVLHWVAHHAAAHHAWVGWVLLIGATIVLFAAGSGFYKSAWSAAKRFTTNMDTLIAIGATTAYVFSLVVFIAQHFGRLTDQPLYFAESAALFGIISLGHWLEARATANAGSAVRELLELQPDEAELLVPSESPSQGIADAQSPEMAMPGLSAPQTRTIRSADVKPGDHLLIRPGARVPVDGEVIDGESNVDESIVTGESMPVRRMPGDHVVAGAMNTTGRLVIRAKVDGRHTTIARIAEMVQRAQSSKANIQRLADRVASIFVPTVLVIAGITFVGWWIAGNPVTGIIATVTVLIISCPCALGLATPMAVVVGTGAASKRGILIKSASALETAGNATHVVFDKTGTLTAGAATVSSIKTAPGMKLSEDQLLELAAAVESSSEHPIARAIVSAAKARGLSLPPARNFQAIAGEGVRGVVQNRSVAVVRDEHATCRVEVDGDVAGTIDVTDQLRPDAKGAVDELRQMGIRVTMLSGDRRPVAESVGAQLGLRPEEIRAQETPESKLQFILQVSAGMRSSLSRGAVRDGIGAKPQAAATVMVGDGINDAAALAQADLGIAMSSATNIAIESADVVIPSDRVKAVGEMIDLARRTLRTIKQNLFFAFLYNVLAIPAAALGLLGLYGPLIAAAAMGLSDITVIGNAIRLKRQLQVRARNHWQL
jgi:Cu+-exporting ATPase